MVTVCQVVLRLFAPVLLGIQDSVVKYVSYNATMEFLLSLHDFGLTKKQLSFPC